jgi:hypothetical protein
VSNITPEKTHEQVQILYNGELKEFPYHLHQRVQVLLEHARRAFGITTNPHLMALFNLEGQELVDDQTLQADHVSAGDELLLRQSVVRGG